MSRSASVSRPVAEDRGNPAECREEDRSLLEIVGYELDFRRALVGKFRQLVDDIDLLLKNKGGGTLRAVPEREVCNRLAGLDIDGLLARVVAALAPDPQPGLAEVRREEKDIHGTDPEVVADALLAVRGKPVFLDELPEEPVHERLLLDDCHALE